MKANTLGQCPFLFKNMADFEHDDSERPLSDYSIPVNDLLKYFPKMERVNVALAQVFLRSKHLVVNSFEDEFSEFKAHLLQVIRETQYYQYLIFWILPLRHAL